MSIRKRLLIALAIICACPVYSKAVSRLPDYSNPGPYEVISGEYKLPAGIDPLVTTEMKTELWAAVFRPKQAPVKPWPLVLFLHGNHGTCGYFEPSLGVHIDYDVTYTSSGTCPEGFTVVKSHRGYDYIASRLASWGYVVVSINVNRGINAAWGIDEDFGLNLRRGRMVLRHLAVLSQWNKNEKPTPKSLKFSLANTMDFSEVGLMGHSRGGEGMRAAWRQYRDDGSPFKVAIRSPLKVRSIFEIAPVDGQTYRTLDADGVSSMVLLPSCDGDVFTLEGVHVFDRMLLRYPEYFSEPSKRGRVRGTFNMLGGNHNFFNTEWQESDSYFCPGHPRLFPNYAGSLYQRITAINSVIPFFIGTVGKQRIPATLKVFDPLIPVTGPLQSVGGLGKGFIHSNSYEDRVLLENFAANKPESYGIPHVTKQVRVGHVQAPFEHDQRIRAAQIDWPILNGGVYDNPSIDIAIASSYGISIAGYDNVGLRLTTKCFRGSCNKGWFDTAEIDASLTLIDVNGNESYPPISLAASAELRRPVGQGYFGDMHSILQNAYLPVDDIYGVDKNQIVKLRITFDRTTSGRILLAEINLQNDPLHLSKSAFSFTPSKLKKEVVNKAELQAWRDLQAGNNIKKRILPDSNRVISVSRFSGSALSAPSKVSQQQLLVKLILQSSRPFPVSNSLPVVSLGKAKTNKVNYEQDGQLTVIFLAKDYDAQDKNAKLELKIGSEQVWKFGLKPNK